MRVLVVDDNNDTLEMMQMLCTSWGYTVDTATSGHEAIAKVKARCPDVIISDLVMPEMSGLDLLRAIKAEACQTRFILLTAYGTVPRGVAAIEQGADEVLLKPLDADVLRVTLAQWGETPMDPS